MQNLALEEGEIVSLKSASLPKGTYVKLQPHTTDFLDISNPKAVLETTLRNFSCLTVGDQITINYNNRQYFIDIVEARPQQSISVVETDCEVDFAPPLDYVEPTRPEPAAPQPQEELPGRSVPKLACITIRKPACSASLQQSDTEHAIAVPAVRCGVKVTGVNALVCQGCKASAIMLLHAISDTSTQIC